MSAPVCSIAPTAPATTAACGGAPKTSTVPRSGRVQAEQHVDRRRLAGAVRAEQRDRLAGRDRDVDAAHGLDRPVGLREVVQLDAGGAYAPWHFLNFLPLPHQHGSLRPTFSCGDACTVCVAPADRTGRSARCRAIACAPAVVSCSYCRLPFAVCDCAAAAAPPPPARARRGRGAARPRRGSPRRAR